LAGKKWGRVALVVSRDKKDTGDIHTGGERLFVRKTGRHGFDGDERGKPKGEKKNAKNRLPSESDTDDGRKGGLTRLQDLSVMYQARKGAANLDSKLTDTSSREKGLNLDGG